MATTIPSVFHKTKAIGTQKLQVSDYEFPASDGLPSNLLVTDGDGHLSFTNITNVSGLVTLGISGVGDDNTIARWDASGNLTYSTVAINDAGDISGANSLTINNYTLPTIDGSINTVLVRGTDSNTSFQRINTDLEAATITIPADSDIPTVLLSAGLSKVKRLDITLLSGTYTGDITVTSRQQVFIRSNVNTHALSVDDANLVTISGFGTNTIVTTLSTFNTWNSLVVGQKVYINGSATEVPSEGTEYTLVSISATGYAIELDATVPGTGGLGNYVVGLPVTRWNGVVTKGYESDLYLADIYLTTPGTIINDSTMSTTKIVRCVHKLTASGVPTVSISRGSEWDSNQLAILQSNNTYGIINTTDGARIIGRQIAENSTSLAYTGTQASSSFHTAYVIVNYASNNYVLLNQNSKCYFTAINCSGTLEFAPNTRHSTNVELMGTGLPTPLYVSTSSTVEFTNPIPGTFYLTGDQPILNLLGEAIYSNFATTIIWDLSCTCSITHSPGATGRFTLAGSADFSGTPRSCLRVQRVSYSGGINEWLEIGSTLV